MVPLGVEKADFISGHVNVFVNDLSVLRQSLHMGLNTPVGMYFAYIVLRLVFFCKVSFRTIVCSVCYVITN